MRTTMLAVLALTAGCYLSHECLPGEYSCVRELTVRPAGLHTDPNPLGSVPDGAMSVARNLAFRRTGVAEGRPGIIPHLNFSSADIHKLIPFAGDLLIAGDYSTEWRLVHASNGEILDQDGNSIQFTAGEIRYATAHGELYVTTDDGVVRYVDGETEALRAGMPEAWPFVLALVASGTPAALPTGNGFSYRVAYSRPVGDRVLRGAPSGRHFVNNASGFTRDVGFVLAFPPELIVGDVVEVYRSLGSPTPGDELRLVTQFSLTSALISAGQIAFTDTAPDELLTGAALYTNTTALGIARANHRPPHATDIASFENRVFYGGGRAPHRISVRTERVGAITGLWADQGDGDFTSGSPTISMVANIDFDALRVGQYITDSAVGPEAAGTRIPANTTIVSWDSGAATITMSANALATASGITTYLGDIIQLDGDSLYPNSQGGYSVSAKQFRFDGMNNFADLVNHMSGDIHLYVDGTDGVGGSVEDCRLVFERRDLSDTPFTLVSLVNTTAFVGSSFSENGVATSSADGGAAHLWWSKTLEPDSVPLGASAPVGEETKEILRILPTRDSLFVLKDDGVWRVSNVGDDIQDIRIDPYDTSLQLIHPNAACVMNNRIWAWTNRGLVSFNESGIIDFDTPVRDIFEEAGRAVLHGGDAGYLYVAANESDNEIVVSMPDGERLYVFNTDTSAWAEWRRVIDGTVTKTRDAVQTFLSSTNQGHFYLAGDAATYVLHEDPDNGDSLGLEVYDALLGGGTIDSVSGNTIVLASPDTIPAGTYIFKVGETSTATRVTEDVTASVNVPVEDATGFEASDMINGRVSYEFEYAFTDRFGGDPSIMKHYRESAILYEAGGPPVTVQFYGQYGDTSGNPLSLLEAVDPDSQQRAGVGREAARGNRLVMNVSGARAAYDWRLLGASFVFEAIGERM